MDVLQSFEVDQISIGYSSRLFKATSIIDMGMMGGAMVKPGNGLNTAAQDKKLISDLSSAGKIKEARNILQPHVNLAKNATNYVDKRAALNEIIDRLDVSSTKEKVFWSGDVKLAGDYAAKNGKTILEQTSGGKVINNWDELNDIFTWEKNDLGPYGWDLWGEVSTNYANGALGNIETIQTANRFPLGGATWKNRVWPSLYKNPYVDDITIKRVNSSGNIEESVTVYSKSDEALKLFGSIF
ncbi:hypothetical protein ACR30L_09750 [Psychromonas sp. PT13]|uniref:hypothetical protein n=1 Tax=Psychromonas sp. PT13 TaxID=3439547 RepID=UPI003EBDE80D